MSGGRAREGDTDSEAGSGSEPSAQTRTRSSNARATRSRPEPKSDAQPTGPPGAPARALPPSPQALGTRTRCAHPLPARGVPDAAATGVTRKSHHFRNGLRRRREHRGSLRVPARLCPRRLPLGAGRVLSCGQTRRVGSSLRASSGLAEPPATSPAQLYRRGPLCRQRPGLPCPARGVHRPLTPLLAAEVAPLLPTPFPAAPPPTANTRTPQLHSRSSCSRACPPPAWVRGSHNHLFKTQLKVGPASPKPPWCSPGQPLPAFGLLLRLGFPPPSERSFGCSVVSSLGGSVCALRL